MSERHRRSFTRDFRLAAVKKHVDQGLSAKEVASDLKIDINPINYWQREFQSDGTLDSNWPQAFPSGPNRNGFASNEKIESDRM